MGKTSAGPDIRSAIHDRIFDAYLGAMGEDLMRKTHARVNWICRRVSGQNIIDLGCSQGLVSILLAREGYNVTALDVNPRAIEEARAFASSEAEQVKARLNFLQADCLEYVPPCKVDTVIIAEVLEHFNHPNRVVEAGSSWLVENGTLIVTVPFGINDYIDHKQTYYLSGPVGLLKRHFDIAEIELLGKWIGIVAKKKNAEGIGAAAFHSTQSLLEVAEEGFYAIERRLTDEISASRKRLEVARKEAEEAKAQFRQLLEIQVPDLKETIASLRAELKRAAADNAEQRAELSRVTDARDAAEAKVETLQETIASLRAGLERTAADNAEQRAELARVTDARDAAEAKVETLQETIASLRAGLERTAADNAEQGAELARVTDARDAAEAKVEMLQETIASLRAELERTAAENAEQGAELSRVTDARDAAEAKVETLENTLRETQQLHSSAVRTISTLRAEINELQARLRSLASEYQITKESTTYQLALALANARNLSGVLGFPRQAYEVWRTHRRKKRRERKKLAREQRLAASALDASQRPSGGVLLDATKPSEAKIQLSSDRLRLLVSITTAENIAIVGRLSIVNPADRTPRYALATVRYLDSEGRELSGSMPGISFSEKVGPFTYLRLPEDGQRDCTLLELAPPHDAVAVELGFRTWNAKGAVYLRNYVSVAERGPRIDSQRTLSAFGWPTPEHPDKIAVLSILDEFSQNCFAPHASLIEPRPDNWEGLLEKFQPKFALVESAWKGNKATWQYRVAKYAHPPGHELVQMVDGLRSRGIPTVFWNKEDPVHFDNFIESARRFDLILTTAAEIIPKYKRQTSARVEPLQFAAETSLHNPVGSGERNDKVCFAGSFYANRFAERRADQLMLLDAAADFNLDIFDRNYAPNSNSASVSDLAFPERYRPYVRGKLSYKETSRAYRNYRVFLNVNSVVDSPTMFSRRVFELLACGTPVVSTWSRGTEETFGNDLVWHVKTAEDVREALQILTTDDREWQRRSLAGIRAVFGHHTYRHRFQEILSLIGESPAINDPFGHVVVIGEASTEWEIQRLLEAFNRQQMIPGTIKKMVIAVTGMPPPQRHDELVDLIPAAGPVSEHLNRRAFSGINLVATMSPAAVYGKHYLQDLIHASRYSNAAIVGKRLENEVNCHTYQYDATLDPAALVIKRDALAKHGLTLDDVLAMPKGTGVSGPTGAVFTPDEANFKRLTREATEQEIHTILQAIEV